MDSWSGFKGSLWKSEVNVRDFIQENYTPYEGDEAFLVLPTVATTRLTKKVSELLEQERVRNGVYDVDTESISSITSHKPGYIEAELEKIVGLQTDEPLKRAVFPKSSLTSLEDALTNYGYTLDPKMKEIYSKYRKTHNDGVKAAYTPDIRKACESGLITGLPENYGRGRHIGDYRRVALYGMDYLISQKESEFKLLEPGEMTNEIIQQREELTDQINAMNEFRIMCLSYGFDVSKPAKPLKRQFNLSILQSWLQQNNMTVSRFH
jgi:formate C-acetyltransferase